MQRNDINIICVCIRYIKSKLLQRLQQYIHFLFFILIYGIEKYLIYLKYLIYSNIAFRFISHIKIQMVV